ncbi:MAG: hypothetical protein AAF526_11965 [Pseudomonadota bacterium]
MAAFKGDGSEQGNDILDGGAGNDIFVFAGGSGVDEIVAFDDGQDKIRVEAPYIQPGIQIVQTAQGVVIQLSIADSILIRNANVSEVTFDDFIFG